MEETIGIQILKVVLGLACMGSVPALEWFMKWAEGYRMYRAIKNMDLAECRIKEQKEHDREEMKKEHFSHVDWSLEDEEEAPARRIKFDATLIEDKI